MRRRGGQAAVVAPDARGSHRAAGQYACSELGIGKWNNGTVKFRDLLPAGAILQEMQVRDVP